MKKGLTLAALLLLALPAVAVPATIDLRSADGGRSLCLRGGDIVQIVLPENPSTGFAWRFTTRPDRTVLRLTQNRYVADPQPPGTVGGGGKHTYRFRVLRNGRTSLALGLFGPTAPPTRPTDRFRFGVGC